MGFTQFNREGARRLQAEVIQELVDLGERLGLDISPERWEAGPNHISIKVKFATTDSDAVDEERRREFGRSAHVFGLERDDYGLEFKSQGRRYRLIGIKSNRPKYPLVCECVSTGKVYKFPRNIIQLYFTEAREERARRRAKQTTQAAVQQNINAIAGAGGTW